VVNNYFLNSIALRDNNFQMILVGQKTITTQEEANIFEPAPDLNNEVDSDSLLFNFNKYAEEYRKYVPFDIGILITDKTLSDGLVEFSFLGSACLSNSYGVVSAGYSQSFDASSIARTLARILGACYDPPAFRDSKLCSSLSSYLVNGNGCYDHIMSPLSDPDSPKTTFSECSASDFNDWFFGRAPIPNCLVLPTPSAE